MPDEKAIDAQRKPIAIATIIVMNEDKPNVPVVAKSTKKSAPAAITPNIIGPNFLENVPMIIRVKATKIILSREYLTNSKINLQKYSIQMFKAIFLSNL